MSEADQLIEIERNMTILYRYCLTLTHSPWEAEDIVQEACLRVLPLLKGQRPHANPAALIKRTAKNIWIDQVRRQQLKDRLIQQLAGYEAHTDEHSFEVEHILSALVQRLSPLQLTVFLLRDVFQYKAAEAAARLQMTEGAVKAALHRARKGVAALKQHLDPETGVVPAASQANSEWFQAFISAFQCSDPEALIYLALVQDNLIEPLQAVGQLNGFAQSPIYTAPNTSAFTSPNAMYAA
ncbi:RNA polymerase sigma factor [Paenibacillus mendelii]|uniref:RNA polymerase sigma factor n=1 Tax=Paenibacillus mendelii TaxID=206163 RepID=A0ABV6JL52_9BACL|nr:RNA polymerase sigma factor [Paenibacillus mendelii]MCQ6558134.1 RNA polymerase sigma factor [Paenibacillus mendelii]